MVYGKKQSGRPTQRTMQQNQKRQRSGMQYSGSGEGEDFGGKNACTRCGVVDTRLMHVTALKTLSVSNVARQDISAKCVCPTVRMRSHIHRQLYIGH